MNLETASEYHEKSLYKSVGSEEKSQTSFSKQIAEDSSPTVSLTSLTPEQVFGFEDRSQSYIEKGEYDEAFTIFKKKINLGKELSYARDLVTFYKICIFSKNSEKASRVREQIRDIINSQINCVNARSLQELAQKLRGRGKHAESILFYQLAAERYERDEGRIAASGIANCCSGLRNTIKNFVDENTNEKRSLVQHHVIPLMREMRERLLKVDDIDANFRAYCEAHCLHCVEYIEGLIEDYENCELTLSEAINLMESRLLEDCRRNRVFATLLHNLGYVYEVTGRLEEALELYERALLVDKSAVDYRGEDERATNIEAGENSIRRIGEKFKNKRICESSKQRKDSMRDL